MSDLHIAEFYQDVARILTALYGVFPRPVTLYVEDISGPDEPDEYGVHSPRHQACFAAMHWLGEEGLIRFEDTIRQEAVDQCVLTGQCFTALLTPPPDLEPNNTLPTSVAQERSTVIYLLAQAVKQKDSGAISAHMQLLLQRMASRVNS